MRRFNASLLIGAFCLAASGALAAEYWDAPKSELREPLIKDLVYAERDGFELRADFYPADSEPPWPAVILVHGGGFLRGSKDAGWFTRAANWFASRGFAVLNITYRVIPEGGVFPKNATDVKCAVRWLRAHAEELSVDPDRLGILGESAGGYLASFAAVTPDNERYGCEVFPEVSDRLQAAAVYYGLHDFTIHDQYFFMTMGKLLWGEIYNAGHPVVIHASPAAHAADAPPMFLVHGDLDNLVPTRHSRRMAEELEAAGIDFAYLEYEGLEHGFVMESSRPEAREAFEKTLEFFERTLAPGE